VSGDRSARGNRNERLRQRGKKDRKSATITAELRIPRPGNDRLPDVVLLHGSGGASGFVDDWARELNSPGIAAFIPDGVTQDRGIGEARGEGMRLPQ